MHLAQDLLQLAEMNGRSLIDHSNKVTTNIPLQSYQKEKICT